MHAEKNEHMIRLVFSTARHKTSNQAHFRLQNEIEQRLKPHYGNLAALEPGSARLYLSQEPATTRIKNVSCLCWKKSGRTTAGCLQHEITVYHRRLTLRIDDSYTMRPLFADRCQPVFLRLPLIMLKELDLNSYCIRTCSHLFLRASVNRTGLACRMVICQ